MASGPRDASTPAQGVAVEFRPPTALALARERSIRKAMASTTPEIDDELAVHEKASPAPLASAHRRGAESWRPAPA